MTNIFKEKLGFSICQKFGGTMDAFMANGINYLEVRLVQGDDRPLMQQYIDTAYSEKQRLGFEIYTLHLPQLDTYDLSSLDEAIRLQAIENQKEIVEMSLKLGYKVLVLHPDVGSTSQEDRPLRHEALIKSLKVFAPWCREKGLKLALENLTQISAFQTSDILVKVIEEAGEDNVGICFDVNHLFPETHKSFVQRAGKYILTMHVSDNDGEKERHFLPGDGVLDWKEIFALMDSVGFDGTMICESGGFVMAADDFPGAVQTLREKWLALHE